MKELSMDQLRESIAKTGVDIFEAIEETIKVAACDLPNEFKIRRAEIAEELFSCKYSDGEVKDLLFKINTFNGGMDVQENMVDVDQAAEDSCLDEWEGLPCPPLEDFAFICNKKQEKAPKRQGKQLKLAYHVLKKQFVPNNNACAYGVKRLIPAKVAPPKSQVAVQQHKQRVLEEKTPEDRIKGTKRKISEENEGAENMKRRQKALGVQDRLKQWISRRRRNTRRVPMSCPKLMSWTRSCPKYFYNETML
ncbi:putative mediator of RNA polymerase II transcription subunit 26b [Artemisia annua]|uniref:Putative mediator of RNA polymerase II transcription subunit 26b n=1 Tax=Artemisia annua TaxID=35608 RepID=A0A2U1KI74_ARTAN|nr:putative mediator of RNA polymerase II transcription subunit 26b [Artemisia annua]